MRNSVILLLFIIVLSSCSYHTENASTIAIDIAYDEIKSPADTNSLPSSVLTFIPYNQEKINFNHDENRVVFKFNTQSDSQLKKEAVVVVGHKYFNQVSYYTQFKDGSFSTIEHLYRLMPTENRVYSSEKFVFNFNNHTDVLNHYLIITNHSNSAVSIKLIDKDQYTQSDQKLVIFFTILYSSMFFLFFVYFIYFLYIRNIAYLSYSVYILSALFAIYWQEGRMIDIPTLYYPILGGYDKTFFFILSNITLIIFIYQFLKLNWRIQKYGKILLVWMFYLCLLALATVVLFLFNMDSDIVTKLYNLTVNIGNVILVVGAFIYFKNGNRQAGFLFFALITYIIIASFRLVFAMNPGPNQFWMQHSYEIGLVIETFILALGLADQALGYKKSRDRVQDSFDKAKKALFAESLVNNFLHEIKDEIFKETKVQNFIKHIESYFAQMVLKYAAIENITKLSVKSDLCHKSTLIQQNKNTHCDTFFEFNKLLITQACESNKPFTQMCESGDAENDKKLSHIQIIAVPVSLAYNFDKSDCECLILEVKAGELLNHHEVEDLKVFIDKSILALMESQQLRQITKRAQDIISQAEDKDKAMRLKDRFFANVSHEFRTPLTLTIGPLKDLHKQREFLNTSGKYLVETALSNAQDLMGLVDNILDMQQLEAKKFPLRISKINLNKLIYVVIKKLINWSLDHYQTLIFNKDIENDVYVYCDKKEVEKILVNLVSNAIKYSGKNCNIVISLSEEEDWVMIKICDDGIGIDESNQEHIFERYFQGDSTQHLSEAGTGIGLSYVKDVMELHHGKVTLDSHLDQGSQFELWFKQGFKHFDYDEMSGSSEKTILQQQSIEVIKKAEDDLNDTQASDKTTLLIVEDNPELLKFLVFKFKDAYKILEAENGLVGLKKAIKYLPDLIISDVMMPEMDGMEMLLKLREINELKTVPIILLTAMSANVDAIEGLETGADDYVTKPFDFDELKARVDRLIAARKAMIEGNISQSVTGSEQKSIFQENLDKAIYEKISDKNLNVEVLSELMHLDRSGLYRKIKAEIDMSPVAYIRQVRMDFAMDLLTNKKLSVSQTAYACGYDSLSYFSKQFKKTYGTSPSDVI